MCKKGNICRGSSRYFRKPNWTRDHIKKKLEMAIKFFAYDAGIG